MLKSPIATFIRQFHTIGYIPTQSDTTGCCIKALSATMMYEGILLKVNSGKYARSGNLLWHQ
jgi:hypothetical protein